PWEVPLIELGLDSLMAVRIKNRVEYDFDLPPIQLTAVRDANLYNIEQLITYAIEHRDEVEALHEHQKTLTPEEIAKEQAQLLSGATPASVAAPAPDPQAAPTRPLYRSYAVLFFNHASRSCENCLWLLALSRSLCDTLWRLYG
ncbi:acyl carrier protein, partial [Streptococcus pyogenes]|uniref:acyl carrier protein n=1 Tax=Streptococcus pyogenes TaxID=1314 RepID=UPI003F68AFF9